MCTCIDCGKEIVSGKLCKFCKCFKRDVVVTNKENSMELLVPKSLITAMNRESNVDLNVDDIKNNLPKVIQMISKYEAEHNYVPSEWSMFMDNLTNVLSTLTVKEGESMTNLEVETKRTEWITKLVFTGEYNEIELRTLTMVELRDAYETAFPSYVVSTMGTATGVRKTVTKLKVA